MADLSSLKDLAPASEASAPVHVRKVDTLGRSYATGKRKNAVARVWVKAGSGKIIINGRDLATIIRATQAAIAAAKDTPGLLTISAGNYGGRLGKSFIYLHPEKQPS